MRTVGVSVGVFLIVLACCGRVGYDPLAVRSDAAGCGSGCGECATCMEAGCLPGPDGASCSGGTCYGGVCCSTCWTGAECVPTATNAACGASGVPCADCTSIGQNCCSGACLDIVCP